MEIIDKPWGREEWLERNGKYVLKKIYLMKGKRTSLQYHERKLETSYMLEGKVNLILEDEKGHMTESVKVAGDFYTVVPYRKHRVIALEDSVYLETSTPEVDDVIRVQDDNNRPDGRIESEFRK